jgi:hypothetical protein
MEHVNAHLRDFSSGTSLGGKVSRYRPKQNIYMQGAPASSLFYIESGMVRLTAGTKDKPSAVIAILGGRRLFWRALPCRLSSALVHSCCVVRQLHTYDQESDDASNTSRKE